MALIKWIQNSNKYTSGVYIFEPFDFLLNIYNKKIFASFFIIIIYKNKI